MIDYNLSDEVGERQAAIDAHAENIWTQEPERVAKAAGGAMWLLEQFMITLDAEWLAKTLDDACNKLAEDDVK